MMWLTSSFHGHWQFMKYLIQKKKFMTWTFPWKSRTKNRHSINMYSQYSLQNAIFNKCLPQTPTARRKLYYHFLISQIIKLTRKKVFKDIVCLVISLCFQLKYNSSDLILQLPILGVNLWYLCFLVQKNVKKLRKLGRKTKI